MESVTHSKLIIIGASGHGKVLADLAIKLNLWESISFLDDDRDKKISFGPEVIGKIEDAWNYKETADFIVGIGNNSIRKKIQEMILAKGMTVIKLIHPNAVIGLDVQIGIGSVVMAGAVINCSCEIGMGCIINTGSSVDHDNLMGDYVHISPGVRTAGGVKVGDETWVGIGSIVSTNVSVCNGCMIGAGTPVLKDITSPGVYVGNPLKKLR